jgi:DNA-binding winged helix-turn-helix (wHTH) protein
MRVVSKDDLLQEVWGGRIVSEAARTSRINAVHRALGDDGTAQRLVRTFTRKGIRFIGEVAELPDPVTPATIHKLCRLPLPGRGHQPRGLALLSIPAQLAQRG